MKCVVETRFDVQVKASVYRFSTQRFSAVSWHYKSHVSYNLYWKLQKALYNQVTRFKQNCCCVAKDKKISKKLNKKE